jgi:ribonuclease HII
MPIASRRRSALTDQIAGPADTLYIGVDEAGYGPNIGPLVVSSTAFRGPSLLDTLDWWKVLRRTVCRAGKTKTKFIIDDSKAVLSSPMGRASLDHSVGSMLRLAACPHLRLRELITFLAPTDAEHLCAEHWYGESDTPSDEAEVPWQGIRHERLQNGMTLAALSFDTPMVRVLFPSKFNEALDRHPTKADVECEMILDILSRRLAALPSECKQVVITVDRLGGRRYYREIVESLAVDAFVLTVEEKVELSVYRFAWEGREVEIRFRVQGDSHSLPVAAASMIAKYVRERCMDQFNEFWNRQIPGLQRTAGYPGDSKRFLAEIEHLLQELGISMNSFWRVR